METNQRTAQLLFNFCSRKRLLSTGCILNSIFSMFIYNNNHIPIQLKYSKTEQNTGITELLKSMRGKKNEREGKIGRNGCECLR